MPSLSLFHPSGLASAESRTVAYGRAELRQVSIGNGNVGRRPIYIVAAVREEALECRASTPRPNHTPTPIMNPQSFHCSPMHRAHAHHGFGSALQQMSPGGDRALFLILLF